MVDDSLYQNLEVILPGTQTSETVVIAAHYDTTPDSPGANASASGAAVLLSLARELLGRSLGRNLRLVWLTNESGDGGEPGSQVYAAHTQRLRLDVVATLTLGSLGYYSLAPGSQRYPEGMLYGSEQRTTIGDFVALLCNARSNLLLEHVRPALATASLPVAELVLPDTAALAADGPQSRFWMAGLPGLVLTDTAGFRNPDYGGPGDTAGTVDFERLARVARLLRPLVLALGGPPAVAQPTSQGY
jgi:Zn-dependent M28 family amino/carboxypeptidase